MNSAFALLLTDLVDSTHLNDVLGDSVMGALWQSHDVQARELMQRCHGQEIARSDGFLVLFRHVVDGVSFAVEYHRLLRSLDVRLKARVGLHFGQIAVRENSDAAKANGAPTFEIDGVALPVAARLMSAAQGGQTLLSASAIHQLPRGAARVQAHGHWRLKGVEEPVEFFEVGERDTVFAPPPDSAKAYRVIRSADGWQPARTIPHSLPAERDLFVGRSDAFRAMNHAINGGTRLLTLLGIGGIGKTRLALRYARSWLGEYSGGGWFCDLATSRSFDGVLHAVAQGLDVSLGKSDPVHQLAAAISGRGRCLVILDNFEQVAEHAESTLGIWLDRSPEATFLVTSRQLLGIAGEQALPLDPLAVSEGVELFERRATAVAPSLMLNDGDRAAIGPLVKLLDGLPLAIELAAARSNLLSPRNLLDRMHERFDLLTSRTGRLDRQATLRATLDWSWDLLAGPEKSALAQLSVFEGGFKLPAMEAVIDVSECDPTAKPIDLLQSLVDKSFLRRMGEERFDLLVAVKEYSAERLNGLESPASSRRGRPATECRHWAYYSGCRDAALPSFALAELDNLVVACRRAAAHGAANDAINALHFAWQALRMRGPFTTAIELADAIRSLGGLSELTSARVDRIAGLALNGLGRVEQAEAMLRSGLASALRSNDALLEAQLLCVLGDISSNAGRMDQAAGYLSSALATARRVGDAEFECTVLSSLGSLHSALGQLDTAYAHFQEALEIARRIGSHLWEGGSLGNLAQVQTTRGLHREAELLYNEAIKVARTLGDRRWEGNALCNVGITNHALGRYAVAKEQLAAALVIARDLGQRRLEAVTLCNMGIVANCMGDRVEARSKFERAIDVARELGDRRSEGQFLTYLGSLESHLDIAEGAKESLTRAQVLLESASDRLSLGLLFAIRAQTECRAGSRNAAEEAMRRAEVLAGALNPTAGSEFGVELVEARRLLRSSMRIDVGDDGVPHSTLPL